MQKRFLALLLSICLCFGSTAIVSASAAALPQNDISSSDEIILYQDEYVKLYQTKNVSTTAATDDNYGWAWIEKDTISSFTVKNTHTGKLGVTWKVEASSSNSKAQMWMTAPNGVTVLSTRTVKPSDGDVRLEIQSGVVGTYTVHYMANTTVGMRLMCWTYSK